MGGVVMKYWKEIAVCLAIALGLTAVLLSSHVDLTHLGELSRCDMRPNADRCFQEAELNEVRWSGRWVMVGALATCAAILLGLWGYRQTRDGQRAEHRAIVTPSVARVNSSGRRIYVRISATNSGRTHAFGVTGSCRIYIEAPPAFDPAEPITSVMAQDFVLGGVSPVGPTFLTVAFAIEDSDALKLVELGSYYLHIDIVAHYSDIYGQPYDVVATHTQFCSELIDDEGLALRPFF